VAVPPHDEGGDDDILIRADKSPNRRGLTELAAARGAGPHELGEILDRAARGELRALLVLGEDLDAAQSGWLDAARSAGVEIVVLASHESATTAGAGVTLAAGTFPEIAGTVVNFEGRAQAMRAAYAPPRLARSGVWILSRLAARLGAGEPDPGPRQLFESLADALPALEGLSYADVHGSRRPLPTAAVAGRT
jgi:predicted molibdopterin-dependent oxidoreductase YjgC